MNLNDKNVFPIGLTLIIISLIGLVAFSFALVRADEAIVAGNAYVPTGSIEFESYMAVLLVGLGLIGVILVWYQHGLYRTYAVLWREG